MTYQPTELLTVYLDAWNKRRRVGRLANRDWQILFEYDPDFLASGVEISPIKLPLRPGVQIFPGDPACRLADGRTYLVRDAGYLQRRHGPGLTITI